MAKAIRQIEEKKSLADLFIVVLDARAPLSTYNEEFDKIAPHKPRLFVITKKDMADEDKLDRIRTKFNHDKDGVVIVNLKQSSSRKKIMSAANKLLADKKQRDLKKGLLKPRLRAFVIGVPNSGKSTLINLLVKKAKAKVGNMPGVTKGQQWINAGEIQLLDTPGILWPKTEDPLVGVKLAIIGSIKASIILPEEFFEEGYKLLSKFYPNKLRHLGVEPASKAKDIYDQKIQYALKNNFITKDGKPNLPKTHTHFINYLRDLKGVTYD